MLFSSDEVSEAVSSVVKVEVVSRRLPVSLSDEDTLILSSAGCFKYQYIILAVSTPIDSSRVYSTEQLKEEDTV
nr:hypothetical protein Iba_chr12eCG13390 [Ipomoea batatas]